MKRPTKYQRPAGLNKFGAEKGMHMQKPVKQRVQKAGSSDILNRVARQQEKRPESELSQFIDNLRDWREKSEKSDAVLGFRPPKKSR